MTTTRPYHQPRTHAQVMAVLDDMGDGHFDPHLRRHFDVLVQRQVGL